MKWFCVFPCLRATCEALHPRELLATVRNMRVPNENRQLPTAAEQNMFRCALLYFFQIRNRKRECCGTLPDSQDISTEIPWILLGSYQKQVFLRASF